MKKLAILTIIAALNINTAMASCKDDVLYKLDEQEATGYDKAVYIEDRGLSITTFELWEVTQKDIQLTLDAKCNNKSLSLCHQRIETKIYQYERNGIQLSYEDKSEIYWRCETYKK